jgi:hypothetical protein
MTLPETFHFVIEQGKTFKWWFAIEYPDGQVANLPADGYSIARLQVRPMLANQAFGDAVLTLTTENGGIVLGLIPDGAGMIWSGYLYASPTTTATLTPWGLGLAELELDNGAGDVVAALRATAVLETEPTR